MALHPNPSRALATAALKAALKATIGAATLLAALAPAGTAQAHGGPLNQAALQACQAKARSDACAYDGHHDDRYLGTCQPVSDTALSCVRNQPIRKLLPAPASTPASPSAPATAASAPPAPSN